jgi:hypothetical protein
VTCSISDRFGSHSGSVKLKKKKKNGLAADFFNAGIEKTRHTI